VKFTKRD